MFCGSPDSASLESAISPLAPDPHWNWRPPATAQHWASVNAQGSPDDALVQDTAPCVVSRGPKAQLPRPQGRERVSWSRGGNRPPSPAGWGLWLCWNLPEMQTEMEKQGHRIHALSTFTFHNVPWQPYLNKAREQSHRLSLSHTHTLFYLLTVYRY